MLSSTSKFSGISSFKIFSSLILLCSAHLTIDKNQSPGRERPHSIPFNNFLPLVLFGFFIAGFFGIASGGDCFGLDLCLSENRVSFLFYKRILRSFRIKGLYRKGVLRRNGVISSRRSVQGVGLLIPHVARRVIRRRIAGISAISDKSLLIEKGLFTKVGVFFIIFDIAKNSDHKLILSVKIMPQKRFNRTII